MSTITHTAVKPGQEITVRFTNGHDVTGVVEATDKTTITIGTVHYKRDMIWDVTLVSTRPRVRTKKTKA